MTEGVVFDAGENDVIFLGIDNFNAGSLAVVFPVVADPGVPEDLMTEAFFVSFDLGFEVVLRVRGIGRNFEGVGGGAQANDRAATVKIVHEMVHLVAWKIEETSEDDEEVGILEGVHVVDVGGAGFEEAIFVYA